nr:hypothetical protein [Tanacetum cinerariifolium]
MFTPSDTDEPKMQTEEDLRGDEYTDEPKMQTEEDLRGDECKYYEAEIEEMNLIPISIPNDIYNSVDA